MLNKSEVDYILKNNKAPSGPFITLNDTLTEEEIKELNNAVKEYADKNNKKINEINQKDMYFIAKKLDLKKFIFHDK